MHITLQATKVLKLLLYLIFQISLWNQSLYPDFIDEQTETLNISDRVSAAVPRYQLTQSCLLQLVTDRSEDLAA